MLTEYLLTPFVLIVIYSIVTNCAFDNYDNDYNRRDEKQDELIHRLCTHRSIFTFKEIETVKIYIQNLFRNEATIKPQKPPCLELKVYRDFKCLTHFERVEWVNALLKLYPNGFIDDISKTNARYWVFVHMMAEQIPWHNKILTVAQDEIEKINSRVLNPYWDTTLDFGAPERSIVWDYIGRAGNRLNDYCIPEAPFSNLIVKNPTPHCLKRQWNKDGTISSWESPEVLTYILQQSIGSAANINQFLTPQHFKKHLNSGGYYGDYSFIWAPNDPVFWLFHNFELGQFRVKWQFQSNITLTPIQYGSDGKHVPPYECTMNGSMVLADIATDKVLGYNSTQVEEWQIGFGDNCYIQDVMVEAFLNVANNVKPRYPAAVDRLRHALPPQVFAEFFPKFEDNTANEFNYILPDVGNNGNHRCRPLPIPPRYNSSANGKRQFDAFKQCDINAQPNVLSGEQKIERFINTLNAYGYCSPYL